MRWDQSTGSIIERETKLTHRFVNLVEAAECFSLCSETDEILHMIAGAYLDNRLQAQHYLLPASAVATTVHCLTCKATAALDGSVM